ncbi:MAG: virulence RhuM family protein [Sulfurovum sp.]|nr:virulence RhuM family protein [Sulfurovum sp.]
MMNTDMDILIYQTEDGQTKIETTLKDETLWLTQAQFCDLFQKSKSTISEHIKNIFEENELHEKAVVRNFRTTASDGKNYATNFYNLDMIIAVGYRVKSPQGIKFRQWASAILKEYIVKGFAMNDELLKEAGGGSYFEELLARIRDIRSSEKVFWRKVLDVYATSIDYDPKSDESVLFFKTVQNKMHWATHGSTASEIVYQRADAQKENMGLSTFKGTKPSKQETQIAKNYLNEEELNMLNRMVTAYIEIAEIQAMNREPMYMKNWVERLDDFLKMTGKEVLEHAGKISHSDAMDKANKEYLVYKEKRKNELSKVEEDFMAQLDDKIKKVK